MRNKKGFTLVEILLVIAVLGMLAVAAITSYINATGTFSFLSGYKSVMSSIRAARVYSITNTKKVGEIIERYAVKIDGQCVILFKDDLVDSFNLGEGDCKAQMGNNTVIKEKSFDFTGTDYSISVSYPTNNSVNLPVYLFYDAGTGDFKAYQSPTYVEIPKDQDHRFFQLKFLDTKKNISKYIVLFQVSGLAEETNQLIK